MHDLTDIAFIHTHTKSNGGNNTRRGAGHKFLLNLFALFTA